MGIEGAWFLVNFNYFCIYFEQENLKNVERKWFWIVFFGCLQFSILRFFFIFVSNHMWVMMPSVMKWKKKNAATTSVVENDLEQIDGLHSILEPDTLQRGVFLSKNARTTIEFRGAKIFAINRHSVIWSIFTWPKSTFLDRKILSFLTIWVIQLLEQVEK